MKRKLGIVCDCIKKSSPVDNLDVIKDVCSVHVCSNDDGAIADLIEYIENQQEIQ